MIKRPARLVRVVDAEGRPLAGANVSVVWSSVPVPEIALLTDAHGVLRLPLPPGRFRLRAHAPGSASGEAEVDGCDEGEIVLTVKKGTPN